MTDQFGGSINYLGNMQNRIKPYAMSQPVSIHRLRSVMQSVSERFVLDLYT